MFKPLQLGVGVMLGCLTLAAAEKESVKIVGNSSLEATLVVNQKRVPLKGSASIALKSSEEALEKGRLKVQDFNIVLLGAPQQELSGKKPEGKATGVLGFSTDAKEAEIEYDAAKKVIRGRFAGLVDFPQLGELAKIKTDPDEDSFTIPRQAASAEMTLQLDKAISLESALETNRMQGTLDLTLRVRPLPEWNIRGYELILRKVPFIIDWTKLFKIELVRSLCLQPVSIKASAGDASPTGAGLAFGMPGANKEWRKADVVFKVRSTKSFVSSTLKIASQAEMGSILSQVQDDDCVEVFFAQEFSPNALFGGGATFASGTASAQIVSSDQNAVGGIDLTHLAHELGHVMKLAHPGSTGSSGTLIAGSTGTLMCPSGFMNDNPKVNSQENKNNISNPLFKFGLRIKSAGPDCTDSPDCGSCP